jgi:PAS domain S-box-containing protein
VEAALADLAAGSLDAVLLDLSLPDGNVLESLSRIQSAAPETPILVLWEPAQAALIPEAAARGALGFALKAPFDAAQLMRTLQFALAHKAEETALRHSEEHFRDIVENMSESYYELDFNGYMIYVNKHMCAKTGWTLEEFRSNPTQDFVAPDERERMYNLYTEVFKTGTPKKLTDWRAVDRVGNFFDIETSISLIRDAAGTPIAFSGISREVTAQVAALKALEQSKEKHRSILENLQDAYFEIDLHGRMTFFNAAMGSISGYSSETLMAMDIRDYMDADNADRVEQAYRRIYQTGEPNRSLQYEIITKSGERRFIESAVSLRRDEAGRPDGYRAVARDITYRKEAELELALAKERAEAATRAKSEFLANMSHEIRTPMNGIIGMYNLLQDTPLTTEQADFVETGKRSAETLLGIINDILDLSKMEAGKQEIEKIDFDLRETVDDLVTAPARLAQQKGLELIYSIHPDVPSMLRGDPARLRQAIVNLLLNAVKFTPQGEVALFVALEKENDRRVTVRFAVNDTGIGISKADQARLFRSFHQVDTSSTRKYGGAGLGLAISSKLAELMGGRMGVQSKPGQGSTFWLTAVFEKAGPGESQSLIVPEEIRKKRILIVDDNKTNLDIIEGYLKSWGCACDRATGGELALALMHAVSKVGAPYDLVISDMLMPEMDGAELGRRIKADVMLRNSILVMLTSQGMRGDAAEMRRVGFAAYLTKPVRPSLLLDCLLTVLSQGQGQGTATDPPLVTNHSLSAWRRRQVRILLVEDNPINQKLTLHLLERFGMKADAVADGQAAVEALAAAAYDLVLMDIEMPRMDGWTATRIIRDPASSVLDHTVPILAMTAGTPPMDGGLHQPRGMDGYLAKPIVPEELLRAIEKLTNGKRAEAPQP